ncbi:MAG: hypothetical protein ACXVGG_14405, partial [Mycobacteriaceae bacterium]
EGFVNDGYGHQAGDIVLVETVRYMGTRPLPERALPPRVPPLSPSARATPQENLVRAREGRDARTPLPV